MLAYHKNYSEFCSDINRNRIVAEIMKATNRSFGDSEKRAFKFSLQCVKNALSNVMIPPDAEVGIEYKVPLTNKRIDFVLAGTDDAGNSNVVIVELKQWDKVMHTDMNDIVLLGNRQAVHPSWQAYSYGTTISNFNEFVDRNNVRIYTCTFLHDYDQDYEGEIRHSVYKEGLNKAPAFLSTEWDSFADFIGTKICRKADVPLLFEIEKGRVKPSEFLVNTLGQSLNGNHYFELIGDQRIVFSNLKKQVEKGVSDSLRRRKVIIVKGGAGTGKSVIAIRLLEALIHEKHCSAFYVAKSSYIKESYYKMLTRNVPNYKHLRTLFLGSGDFHKEGNNTSKQFDCLIVDEAHRLTEKTKRSFMYYGENQIREIIHASKVSVFFIDETQQIDIKDFGTVENIRAAAAAEDAEILEDSTFELHSQFRCNGSDEYVSWVESVLYNRKFISDGEPLDYTIELVDSAEELHEIIQQKNMAHDLPCRMLSGDVFPWLSRDDKTGTVKDIHIGNFEAAWNRTKSFAVNPASVNEVGCIHTSQGMEFEYVGLIIGDDLLYRNGKVITDYTRHPDKAGEFRRPHQQKVQPEDLPVIDRLIRNTYKVLFTRGQKGIYIYCMDPSLKEYLKKRIKDLTLNNTASA
ncbi:MAG: DUF2075 domain-containing protein [Solobacterium sp.]|nr:DUF2075 domain-containing protein [Solobacterium sp.]